MVAYLWAVFELYRSFLRPHGGALLSRKKMPPQTTAAAFSLAKGAEAAAYLARIAAAAMQFAGKG
jgi:hypothetical protein